jgi:hypothetical protein
MGQVIGLLLGLLLTTAANAAILCSQPIEDYPEDQRGEWVLRCRYQDAQPQYTSNAVIRLLRKFDLEVGPKTKEASEKDSLEFLKDPAVRARVFEAYGLYYDDSQQAQTVPAGFNVSKTRMIPVMTQNGDLMLSRMIGKNAVQGVTVNCLICHTSIVPTAQDGVGAVSFGTPNVFADLQKLHEALSRELETSTTYPGAGSIGHAIERNPLNNSFVNSADFYGVIAGRVRDPFPSINKLLLMEYLYSAPNASEAVKKIAPLSQNQPFLKTQPWASYRYKKAHDSLYVDGGFKGNTAAVTYRLAFSVNRQGDDYLEFSKEFDKYVPQFLAKVTAPEYPFAVKRDRVKAGHEVYQNNCAQCHGDFTRSEDKWDLDYPSHLEEIGTDSHRYRYFTEILPQWTGKVDRSQKVDLEARITFNKGYVAPPLVGIWSRAPYLHNGSVANIRQLLEKPSKRFSKFGVLARPTEHRNYDQTNIGWVSMDLSDQGEEDIAKKISSSSDLTHLRVYSPEVRSRFYDRDVVPGLSNSGHDLGASPFNGYLSAKQLDDLLEFLKTI